MFRFFFLLITGLMFLPTRASEHCYFTIESLPGAHPFSWDPDPHGPPDVSRFFSSVGQVGVELLCSAANH